MNWFKRETNEEVKTKILARLSFDDFKKLEASCARPVVTNTTTELEAGYALGVQSVLKKLRDGFVVEE